MKLILELSVDESKEFKTSTLYQKAVKLFLETISSEHQISERPEVRCVDYKDADNQFTLPFVI